MSTATSSGNCTANLRKLGCGPTVANFFEARSMFRILPFTLALLLAPEVAWAQDMSVSGVLIDGQGWQLVSEGYKFTEGPAVDAEGQIFFTDIPASRIYKIGLDDKVSLFAEGTANT